MKTLALAAAFASAVALPLAPAAAGSGGQVSINIAPQNAQEEQALRFGLAVFALAQDIDANGHVTQIGANNAAGIAQGGPNNQAIIHQEGCNHDGSITQSGGHNAHGLFQFGCNTSGHVNQTGGQAGLTLQFGW
ncbi:curlin [Pararhodobacter oceanensis]|uniref:Curlin n=1 Tax=Pararhodobacter oceanensis TaxID=2172121 RepID=A0A2T8HVG8_9RHOB|nr:curlin [Pararhodobacter oceanensis]PVH29322.1 curlin [Pararhodobacter oceanensis]